MMALLTTGGRGLTRALPGSRRGASSRRSVSIDGDRETHDRLRGVVGSYDAAMQAFDNLREAGIKVSANTQINRLSMPLMPFILERIAEAGVHSWQISSPSRWAAPPTSRGPCSSPTICFRALPLLGDLRKRCDEAKVRMWPRQQHRRYGPYESTLRGTMPRGHMASCGAGRSTLGIEADGAIKERLASDRYVGRRQHPRPIAEGHLGAHRALCHARPHRRGPLGLLPRLLLQRRLPRGLHLDELRALRQGGQQPPTVTTARFRAAARGQRERW
ncbi:MAG: hypothetical protein R3B82_23140 [Sandaracinaceae bacterium]